jgi:hypothetical protein
MSQGIPITVVNMHGKTIVVPPMKVESEIIDHAATERIISRKVVTKIVSRVHGCGFVTS